MRDRVMSLLAIAMLSVVCAASYFYARALHQQAPLARPHPGTPDMVVERFVFTQFDAGGEPRRRLQSDRMAHDPDTDDVTLERPRLTSLRADQPVLEARSEQARLEGTGELLRMRGEVVVLRASTGAAPPLRIDTERLLARLDEDRYVAEAPVQLTLGGSTATADRMVLDNVARTVALDGRVRNLIVPRDPLAARPASPAAPGRGVPQP